jgi:hypothetical protein
VAERGRESGIEWHRASLSLLAESGREGGEDKFPIFQEQERGWEVVVLE